MSAFLDWHYVLVAFGVILVLIGRKQVTDLRPTGKKQRRFRYVVGGFWTTLGVVLLLVGAVDGKLPVVVSSLFPLAFGVLLLALPYFTSRFRNS